MKDLRKGKVSLGLVLCFFLSLPLLLSSSGFCQDDYSMLYGRLWTRQSFPAGQFKSLSTQNTLVIVINPLYYWRIVESRVEVVPLFGDFPMNKGGNVKVGHFRWEDYSLPTPSPNQYYIPFDTIAPGLMVGDQVKIAIRAVLVKLDNFSNIIQEEAAWGGPIDLYQPFPPGFFQLGKKSWVYYFLFTL